MTELQKYKSALLQYKLSRWLPKIFFRTQFGFCFHFGYRSFPPILESLAPINDGGHWFKKGKLKPRIKLLKQAIEICEKESS